METRPLFAGGPDVSVIGLSLSAPPTASLPLHQLAILAPETEDPAANGEDSLAATIRRAVELGVNLIDTDWITASGHAQEVLGRCLQALPREKLVIASKAGPRLTFKGALTVDNSRANIINQVHDSLFRLKLSRVDLLQIHWPDDSPAEQTARGLSDAMHAGLASSVGVCNYSASQAAALAAHVMPTSVQAPLSVLNRKACYELLPWCRASGVAFLASDPLLSGLLQGRFSGSEEFAESDLDEWFTQPAFSQAVKFAARLDELARERGWTGAQTAVAWALHQPGVTSVLVPASTLAEFEELAAAADIKLKADDLSAIDKLR